MNIIKAKKIRNQFESLFIRCENNLVSELFKERIISRERNLLNRFSRVPEWFRDNEELKVERKISEWWSVNPWLLEQLKRKHEPILITPYGTYWGRCNTGESVFNDTVMEAIYDEIYS